ncbi:fungal transcriptional regulatory protein [Niveomyces insectorum RCEF 264]|uniref:Fungal transcriptional regulatory protein n=1 Tax=Niveomyces insectorum RCEF 264 TaxID=1081102 RepID=A0A167YXG7_9HYPO|nr:fungal transcriptional regulatory protein [Niveomyces insectorum RCEF 264]
MSGSPGHTPSGAPRPLQHTPAVPAVPEAPATTTPPALLVSSRSLTPASADIPRFRPRACARCSVSKLKCNWLSEPGEAPCERCVRSKTECVLPNLKPRGPRRVNPTRVGQLEQKIDGIMSLLTASKHIQKTTTTTTTTAAAAPRPLAPATLAGEVSSSPERGVSPALTGPPSSSPQSPASMSAHHHQPQQQQQQQQQQQTYLQPTTHPITPSTPGTPGTTSSRDRSSAHSPQYQFPQRQQQQQQQPPPPPPPQQQQHQQPQSSIPLLRLPPLEHIEVAPGLKITFHDADLALADYRALYSPYFPFVPVPPGLSAYELFKTQPFLFRVLVLVVLPQPPQMQRDVKRWLREQIAQHVVIEEKKDVADLQAILLYAAWIDSGYYIDAKVTPLLQLATGLVADLGLNQSAPTWRLISDSFVSDAAAALAGMPSAGQVPERSTQEMRAVLGCYYVYALSSSLFRRTPVFPFSGHMARCCDALLRAREYASDTFLVALVAMQRLAARIYAALPNLDAEPSGAPAAAATSTAPTYMTIAVLRKELDALVESQPPEVKSNTGPAVPPEGFFWTHYHSLLMRLYEPVILLRPSPSVSSSSLSPSSPAASAHPADAARRTEHLWACLQATQDFFDAYTAIPTAVLSALPLMAMAHLSFGIVTVSRLLLLDGDPDWHVGQARRTVDFVAVALRLEAHFQAADDYDSQQDRGNGGGLVVDSSAPGAPSAPPSLLRPPSTTSGGLARKRRYGNIDNRPILLTHRDKMRWIRTWYTTKISPPPPPPAPSSSSSPSQRPRPYAALAARSGGEANPSVPLPSMPPTPQQQQQQLPLPPPSAHGLPPTQLMDLDTEGFAIPHDEVDSVFWKAIFDLDGSWNPSDY